MTHTPARPPFVIGWVHSTARDGLEFLLRHRDPKQARLGIDDVMRTYDRLLRG